MEPLDPWHALVAYLLVLLAIVGLGEWTRARGWDPRTSRKLVHALVGLTLASAPLVSAAAWPLWALGGLFLVVNGLALRSQRLAGMHDAAPESRGTVIFPLGFLALVWLCFDHAGVFVVSMVILALADTVGALVGERRPEAPRFRWWRDPKSRPGSVAVGMTSAAIALVLLPRLDPVFAGASGPVMLTLAVCLGLVCALCEGASSRGSDNLTLPLGAALTLLLLRQTALAPGELAGLAFGVLAALAIGLGAWRLGSLTGGGAVGTILVGGVVFGGLGLAGAAPLVAFFALSSALSRVSERLAQLPGEPEAKGARRDIVQVFCNGGPATACALIAVLGDASQGAAWYAALVGSLAAATADTWGTELGRLAHDRPRRLWPPFAEVEPGTSGGVTGVGTLGAAAGALVTTLVAWPFLARAGVGPGAVVLVALIGFAASLFDSVLGATLQVRYRDPVTNTPCEWPPPGGAPLEVLSGLRWLTNDGVNLATTLLGAALAYALVA
ncbi:MAG: DUF92 domain-containing protein [Myxococcales bacterium]|nr:DUF92 domain-containing protein [Myxococcales bacterium]